MGIRFINNGKGGGSSKISLNIFAQENEPTEKNGIWLQSNKTFDKVCVDTDIVANEEWDTTTNYPAVDINTTNGGGVVAYMDNLYIFSTTLAYKYNPKTFKLTKLKDIPFTFNGHQIAIIEDNIYLFLKFDAYKYSIKDDTYTKLSDSPISIAGSGSIAYGKDIYFFGGAYTKNMSYKYNTDNDSWIQMSNMNYSHQYCNAVLVGDDVYILGNYDSPNSNNNRRVTIYHIKSNSYSYIGNIIPFEFYDGSAIAYDNYIYLFGSGKSSYKQYCYKYDTKTNNFTKLPDIPISKNNEGYICLFNETIYLFIGSLTKQIVVFNLNIKEYEDNSILINQGFGNFCTQLINSDVYGTLKYYFHDVWHYTRENGLDKTIPTYYGNGTEWIKFKN